ncbi:hypothetical protein KBTX_02679 [wastewater metagenome]|uniref:Polymerase nucleotidyl transferase domain-containing protein n=2 Tax=unclassified sequences TaxID=12908 RepID=A0A5B8RHY2_9ZZZZ|nr:MULTISPECIES: nucleotidyltransferase domain-containing protein [Arhodomonas]MCS4503435.1 nucleotidyltransferase domain-containing protein [Arhodomonas aquaeolei]QEA06347.1 hypothetical protein KBTEX_02679 [uncultured organism]
MVNGAHPEIYALRLSDDTAALIRRVVREEAEPNARVFLFGSRLRDDRRGGDIDLLVEIDTPVENPAWLAAGISGRLTRLTGGREVDVVLSAPNLQRSTIHARAAKEGRQL